MQQQRQDQRHHVGGDGQDASEDQRHVAQHHHEDEHEAQADDERQRLTDERRWRDERQAEPPDDRGHVRDVLWMSSRGIFRDNLTSTKVADAIAASFTLAACTNRWRQSAIGRRSALVSRSPRRTLSSTRRAWPLARLRSSTIVATELLRFDEIDADASVSASSTLKETG